jgi:hypothetical protein
MTEMSDEEVFGKPPAPAEMSDTAVFGPVAGNPTVEGQQGAGEMLDAALKKQLPSYKPEAYQPTFIPTPASGVSAGILKATDAMSAVPQLARSGSAGLSATQQPLIDAIRGSAPNVISQIAEKNPSLLSKAAANPMVRNAALLTAIGGGSAAANKAGLPDWATELVHNIALALTFKATGVH